MTLKTGVEFTLISVLALAVMEKSILNQKDIDFLIKDSYYPRELCYGRVKLFLLLNGNSLVSVSNKQQSQE